MKIKFVCNWCEKEVEQDIKNYKKQPGNFKLCKSCRCKEVANRKEIKEKIKNSIKNIWLFNEKYKEKISKSLSNSLKNSWKNRIYRSPKNKSKWSDILENFNKNSDRFELISTEDNWIKNSIITIKCKYCNSSFNVNPLRLKNSIRCMFCKDYNSKEQRLKRKFDEIKDFFNNYEIEKIKWDGTRNSKFNFKCKNGHIFHLNNWQRIMKKGEKKEFCKTCAFYNGKLMSEIKSENYIFLDTFKNEDNQLGFNFICPNGHKNKILFYKWARGYRCEKCFNEINVRSNSEKDILNWLKSYNINIVENSRSIISPLELDFYLPDYKLAIEFNGLYFHSEKGGKNKNYHLNKTNLCKEKGIQLIHVFENEWINKQDIVKSIILAKLRIFERRIFARKCQIRELTNKEYRDFVELNHIQGFVSAKHKIGLFYQDELVQICSFGKSRFKKDEIELIRHCSKLNTQIIGGLSKLLSYYNFSNLVTYVDLRYGNGSGYKNWELIEQTKPNYWYWKSGYILESRIKYQKHKLKNLLEKFDPNLSEHENMLNNGFTRIWDCGNLKLKK